MKKLKRSMCILLALALMFTLAACGNQTAEPEKPAEESSAEEIPAAAPESSASDLEQYAGEYTFLCGKLSAAYMDRMYELGGGGKDIPDQYVIMPEMDGETVTLNADGTGYLDWGENNQGPIDWWKMDGDTLEFQAGVSVVNGTIADGLMTLTIDDGFSACFAATDTDTANVEPITLAEFSSMLLEQDPSSVPEELTPEGEYEIFAVEVDGALVYSDDLEMTSKIILAADGTGSMTHNDDAIDITAWTSDEEGLSIALSDGSSAGCKLHSGVLELDLYGNGSMILCYAKKGADTSGYAPMTLEEYQSEPDSMLYALYSGLDTRAGIHLNYDMHTDYLDADMSYDVHGKDGVYYSLRTTLVSGFENSLVTFFRDGTAYNLYPDDMTGIVATTTTSSYIMDNIMLMDHLFSDIHSYGRRKDYTQETRDLDGVSYTVELFPERGNTPEAAFYFKDDGQLAFCFKGAPVAETAVEIGETAYTIHTIDQAVNEDLFDISGYTIR